jgi:hypothetical protein
MVKLAAWRERVEQLTASDARAFVVELMDEVEYLTRQVTVVQAARMFDRFHAFDGIKDDSCPACGGRVAVDDSDPGRVRLRAMR